jgi:hypothetical protein
MPHELWLGAFGLVEWQDGPCFLFRSPISLYLRFSLSYREVEDLLAERSLDVSYETVRHWVLKLGVLFARELTQEQPGGKLASAHPAAGA